ncbi:metallophosphoesterase family protein [archaeon]|nr:metallophosphoesterase family protein [archaeon]
MGTKHKLRILAASDLHDSKIAVEKLAKKALEEKVDLIILAGDLHSYNEGSKNLLAPLLKTKKKILFVPGNCDTEIEHERFRKDAKSIHGYYVTYDGVGIAGIGSPDWTLKHKDMDFLMIKKQMEKMKPKKKILVSHLHAAGTIAEFSGVPGDDVLRYAIDKFHPDILISGHVHEAEGMEDKIGKTKVFQVGRKGKIIEV